MGRISTKKKLGNKLRDLRKAKGLTQERLSHATLVDRSYISDIERGERNPSFQTLQKLAKALGVSVSELID